MDRKLGGKRIRNVADNNDAKKSGRSIIKIKSINDENTLNPEISFRSADISSKVSIQGQNKARGTKKTQSKIMAKESEKLGKALKAGSTVYPTK